MKDSVNMESCLLFLTKTYSFETRFKNRCHFGDLKKTLLSQRRKIPVFSVLVVAC